MIPQFLQTAFLTGLLALAVPILIHFFFRLKTKRVELGTLRFLRVVMEENARRRKVMRWLLLALRLGVVALLVGVFARPYLSAKSTSGENSLLVIVIDQSATMQLKGERGRLIDQAVNEAKQLVGKAPTGTRTEVAFFDHIVHPITATGDDASRQTKSLVDQLHAPTSLFGATNYGRMFAWTRDLCLNAPPGRKQVHLFTDFQRSGMDWTEVEPLPADVEVHLHDLGNSGVNNIAVTEVRTPRLWMRPNSTPTIQASILYGGAFSLSEVPIVLEMGRLATSNEPEARGTAPFSSLAERITKRERVKLEPGANVVVDFELPPLSEGLWQGRILVEQDDDLSFDNQRFFALSVTPAYRVLLVNGGTPGSAGDQETFFLETSLRLAPAGESFAESPFDPVVIPFKTGAELPDLKEFDAVVLANVGQLKNADGSRLGEFVKKGGGLLIFSGDHVTSAMGATLDRAGLGIGVIQEPKVTVDLPWRLSRWDEKHPALLPLSDPQHGDLRRIIFAAYSQVTPSSDARVVMQFGTGDPALIERKVGDGTVLFVAVSCGGDWSDWVRSRLYLPIMHQLVGYEVGLTQGGRVRMQIIDGVSSLDSTFPGSTQENAESESAGVASPELSPGVFPSRRYCSVANTSPRESDVDRCSRQEFEDRFGVRFVDDNSATIAKARPANTEHEQDEIWHWAACGLLAFLLLEGFAGNRTTA